MILRPYQLQAIDALRAAVVRHKRVILQAPTGAGKCLGRGTPVLLYDGRTVAVEAVQPGDLLLGPDSLPRTVLSVCAGHEMLYRVTPTKGDSYVVNESHILSLKKTRECSEAGPSWKDRQHGKVVNIGVLDFLASTKHFKHLHKGWRADCVTFPVAKEALPLEPYFFGAWLGDGTTGGPAITTGDPEISEYLHDYAKRCGLCVRVEQNSENSVILHLVSQIRGHYDCNPVWNGLKKLKVTTDKRIPHCYKTASVQDRLALLAGVIDTDGSLSNGGFDLTLKSERLLDDVIFVARSLGFAAYKAPCRKMRHNNGVIGDYWRCNISGDIDAVPTKLPRKQASPRKQVKNHRMTGIAVEPVGFGHYFGFELAGPDRLFLLGDFTVTHNTAISGELVRLAAANGLRVAYTVPRDEILDQTSKKLIELGIDHHVLPGGGKVAPLIKGTGKRVLLTMLQTLDRRVRAWSVDWRADVIIVDECHYATSQAQRVVDLWPNAWVVGLSATPARKEDGQLSALYTHTVCAPSIAELQDLGFLVPCRTFANVCPADLKKVKVSKGEYDAAELDLLYRDLKIVTDVVNEWVKNAKGRRTIVFCAGVGHSKSLTSRFMMNGVRAEHLDATSKAADRHAALNRLRKHEIDVICNVGLFVEGLDLVEVECIQLATKTNSLSRYLQMVGRGLRVSPKSGKINLIVLDHGDNWKQHGLPDEDRDWTDLAQKLFNNRKCPNKACGCINPPHAKTCWNCGEPLPDEAPDVSPPVPEQTASSTESDAGDPAPDPDAIEGYMEELDPEAVRQERAKRASMAKRVSMTTLPRPCPPEWQAVKDVWDRMERVRYGRGYAMPAPGCYGFTEANCFRTAKERRLPGNSYGKFYRGPPALKIATGASRT